MQQPTAQKTLLTLVGCEEEEEEEEEELVAAGFLAKGFFFLRA